MSNICCSGTARYSSLPTLWGWLVAVFSLEPRLAINIVDRSFLGVDEHLRSERVILLLKIGSTCVREIWARDCMQVSDEADQLGNSIFLPAELLTS